MRYADLIEFKSDPVGKTPFYVPGVDAGSMEREYVRLQACAHRGTGFRPTDRRIERISCRLDGRDCEVEVGKVDPLTGNGTVVAIIDLGRHLSYGVFTTADVESPAFLVGKRVYSITDFG